MYKKYNDVETTFCRKRFVVQIITLKCFQFWLRKVVEPVTKHLKLVTAWLFWKRKTSTVFRSLIPNFLLTDAEITHLN